MAKDDYFVIVYSILSYLYTCLKKGKEIDLKKVSHEGMPNGVSKKYYTFIMNSLINDGLITGVTYHENILAEAYFEFSEELSITVKGIQYLEENTVIEKAKLFLKDIKDITPFI